jgi:hypothetical protein
MTEGNAYRSVTTGDLGFLVTKGDRKFIRLDRPNQVVERPFKEKEWIAEEEHRPLLPHQIGRVKFEAEKWLLTALGDNVGHKMDWQMMNNFDRNAWLEEESDHALVRRLHAAIAEVLDPLAE